MSRLTCILSVCLLISCTDRLQQALDFAGDNRNELEKVLEHYSASGDEEKLRAAEFLIKYMPGHKSMIGDYASYYEAADSLFNSNESPEEAFKKLPALSKEYDNRISYDFDSRVISAEYLINNIDLAFRQWREGEWARHIDFEEFCEWLLPYSCGQNHPLDNWRIDLEPLAKGNIDRLHECEDFNRVTRAAICIVNDLLIEMNGNQRWYHDDYGHNIYDPSIFVKMPVATCQDYCEVAMRVMLSKGIPVGIDYTTQWPDRFYGHYWASFPNHRGKTTLFNPFSSNPDFPHYPNYSFSKVFRRTYAPNKELMSLLKCSDVTLSDLRTDVFFKDVTDEYMETVDLKVPLLRSVGILGKHVYIAVFNDLEWKPVYWGKARMRTANFANMGRNVTYIVLSREDDKLVPISNPFYVDYDGKVNEIYTNFEGTTDVEIWRKSPMYQHVYRVRKYIKGGYVEGSDNPDFRNSEIVAKLPEWSLTSGKVSVTQSKPYRYWRLCADNGRKCDMAEMFFVDNNGAFTKPTNINALVDGDPLTNYSPDEDKLIEIVDLGAPVCLKEIMYIRRGDGNAIVPGDEYEIYYWHDFKWNLHTSVKASDVCLSVSGLPTGALYYIKGISRGMQNRIFMWDESKKELVWH